MARLALKLFFLRTRVKRFSQRAVADALGVKQAMISQLERDHVKPSLGLLLRICEFYDVSADYLLDEARGLSLEAPDRWRDRNARVVAGMWVEVPKDRLVDLDEQRVLVPLLPGQDFYDAEAKSIRVDATAGRAKLEALGEQRVRDEAALEETLEAELAASNARRGTRTKPSD